MDVRNKFLSCRRGNKFPLYGMHKLHFIEGEFILLILFAAIFMLHEK